MPEQLRVFYSWQSDLPASLNERLIRNALNLTKACCDADEALDVILQIDEATRNESGAPNIKDTIFNKIKAADVFVADISVVGETHIGESSKKLCNPNVAIELGYAIAELGWSRIVLVFNTAFGDIPGEMPFDTGGHRATDYSLNGEDLSRNSGLEGSRTAQLRDAFVQTFRSLVKNNPLKARDEGTQTVEEIRHLRDVEQLKRAFRWIHVNTFDRLLDRLGYGRIPMVALHLHDCLGGLLNTVSFSMHDRTTENLIREFHTSFNPMLDQLSQMEHHDGTDEMRFYTPGDMFRSSKQLNAHDIVCESEATIRSALTALVAHVRGFYLEIDTSETGMDAVNYYNSVDDE